MRCYRCHKIVEAAQIAQIDSDSAQWRVQVGYKAGPDDKAGTFEWIEPPADFFARSIPRPGDYLVRYLPDGYLSWSPAKAFEDGYSLIGPDASRDPGAMMETDGDPSPRSRDVSADPAFRHVGHARQEDTPMKTEGDWPKPKQLPEPNVEPDPFVLNAVLSCLEEMPASKRLTIDDAREVIRAYLLAQHEVS